MGFSIFDIFRRRTATTLNSSSSHPIDTVAPKETPQEAAIKSFTERMESINFDDEKVKKVYSGLVTDLELAVFSALAYKDAEEHKMAEERLSAENKGHRLRWWHVLHSKGWRVFQVKIGEQGFKAIAYVHDDRKQVVIAFRGTEPKELATVWTDLDEIVQNRISCHGEQADAFVRQTCRELTDRGETIISPPTSKVDYQWAPKGYYLTFTGHSLGAWIASSACFNFGYRAVVFDNPGARAIAKQYREGKILPRIADTDLLPLTNYLAQPNLINTAHEQIGYPLQLTTAAPIKEHTNIVTHLLTEMTYSLSQHSIDLLTATFDPKTGRPQPEQVKRVEQWPQGGAEAAKKIIEIFPEDLREIGHLLCRQYFRGDLSWNEWLKLTYDVVSGIVKVKNLKWSRETIQQKAEALRQAFAIAYNAIQEHDYAQYTPKELLTDEEAFRQRFKIHYEVYNFDEQVLPVSAFLDNEMLHFLRGVIDHQKQEKNLFKDNFSYLNQVLVQVDPQNNAIIALKILPETGMTAVDCRREIMRSLPELRAYLNQWRPSVIEKTTLKYEVPVLAGDKIVRREALLSKIAEKFKQPTNPGCPEIMTVYALGGMGKTQLAKQFANESYQHSLYQAVIWLEAEDDLSNSYQKLASRLLEEPIAALKPDGYSLCLMSPLPDSVNELKAGREKSKIYIDSNTYMYKVLEENGVMYEGKLPDNIDLSNLSLGLDNPELKMQILDYISKQGPTQPDWENRLKGLLQERYSSILFIFNGVNAGGIIEPYLQQLPNASTVDVLITTRNVQVYNQYGGLPAEKFSPEEAREYMYLNLPELSISEEDASNLAETIDYHPLSLSYLLGYIKVRNITVKECLKRYKQQNVSLLLNAMKGHINEKQGRAIWLSLKELSDQSPLAHQILNACAFLAADDISKAFLKTYFDDVDEEVLEDALMVLSQSSLLNPTLGKPGYYHTHRLLQDVARYELEQMPDVFNETTSKLLKIFNQLIKSPETILLSADINTTAKAEAIQLYTHAEVVCSHLKSSSLPSASNSYAELLYNLGRCFYFYGKYSQASYYYSEVLKIYRQIHGDDNHFDIGKCLNNLGSVCLVEKNYSQAAIYIQNALDIFEKINSNDDLIIDIAKCLNNLGIVFRNQGEYTKAIDCYQKALKIHHKYNNYGGITSCLNNLGLSLRAQGEYAQAMKCYQDQLKLLQEMHNGDNHHDVALCLNNMGLVFYSQHEYEKAISYYKQALKLYGQIHNEYSHPDIAGCLNNLANVFYDQKIYSEAVEYYQQSLSIRRKNPSRGNLDIARLLNRLGNIHHMEGNYLKALEFYQEALELYRKIDVINNHKDIIGCLLNLGDIFYRQNNSLQAIGFYQEALLLIEDEDVAHKLIGLNGLLGAQQKISGSDNDPDVADILLNLALVNLSIADREVACEQLKKAYSIYLQHFGVDHLKTKSAQDLLKENCPGYLEKIFGYAKAEETLLFNLDARLSKRVITEPILVEQEKETNSQLDSIALLSTLTLSGTMVKYAHSKMSTNSKSKTQPEPNNIYTFSNVSLFRNTPSYFFSLQKPPMKNTFKKIQSIYNNCNDLGKDKVTIVAF